MFESARRERNSLARLVGAVAFLGAVVILGACTETSTETAVTDTTDGPCDLLTVDTIDEITGWTLPEGTRVEEREQDDWSYCNWEDLDVGGSVQVQWRRGDGRVSFEQRRAELEDSGLGDTRAVDIAGADAAYDVADHGVVGVLVGVHFLQISAIGASVDDRQHLELAEAAASQVDRS